MDRTQDVECKDHMRSQSAILRLQHCSRKLVDDRDPPGFTFEVHHVSEQESVHNELRQMNIGLREP